MKTLLAIFLALAAVTAGAITVDRTEAKAACYLRVC
jgi:hypothetical protein